MAGACFPNNAQHRTYAKLAEGASLVGGITMLFFVNSGADCDAMSAPGGQPDMGCKDKATVLGDIGLGLILVGLIGFIATVSTAEDDKPAPVIVPKPEDKKPEDKKPEAPAPAPAPPPAPAAPEPVPAGAGAG